MVTVSKKSKGIFEMSNNCKLRDSNHLNTRQVWYLNGICVDCQKVRFSNGRSENRTEKSLFVVQNVRYLNSPPSHETLPFEYQIPILVFRWILYSGVKYSDGYCIYKINFVPKDFVLFCISGGDSYKINFKLPDVDFSMYRQSPIFSLVTKNIL